ncbi:hypothetical protein pEaSNUABM5_00234 [Erwinia phage pEa_SNUABM_5]|uniref:Uncharacterized protein n=1 Tax=Erwinia phage pEa_SNUABM_5 TaxID=2797313 RepID=A0A7T8IVS1_9CAUD|nr:hypothetical protein MPK73_gp234 [Erwinia phage pEa_SNUABM_5]QQO90376.1 hypothetical protein pEaSNUABM5_00234 [Erwinia phage pEa_SNUABM_5]
MQQVFATNLSRRYYDAHWLKLCRQLGLDAQRDGAFNGDTMIGLKIDLPTFESILPKLAHLNRVQDKVENEVPYSVYLFGTRRYRFVKFKQYCAITEVSNEDV